MNKTDAIRIAKEFRVDADALLQRMKEHRQQLISTTKVETAVVGHLLDDPGEAIAQHVLSFRDLESCIMRQGMVLKAIGNPTPYPNSYDPKSPVVDPTADGLKL